MRTRPIQMNFTNGEISPRLWGRSDLAKYWNSVEILENFVILPYGGVTRRDGLHYVCAQKTETRKVRLIPFIFSTEQAYIIEAGHEYMRFYMNHGQILDDPDVYTVLLLHMNGSAGSQTFTDSGVTGHTVTANNTAQMSTWLKKFGSASGLFVAYNGDTLTVGDHADFDFSADDVFTIETNIYQDRLSKGGICMQKTDDDNAFQILVHADGHVSFGVRHTGVSQDLETAAGVLSPWGWHHIRVVGNGTNYYLFVDGKLLDSAAITKSMQNFTGDFTIGGTTVGAGSYFDGWLDEFRVSNYARSIADFAPPTQEFPLPGEDDPYEIETPYLESDLPLLKFKYSQSYDTMYIFHPDHAWRKLTRTGHAAWTLNPVDFTDGPWLEEATDVNFQSDKKVAGDTGATITADGAWFTGPYDADSPHIDSILRLYISGSWGYVRITAVADSTHCTADVITTLGDTATNSTKYQEGAWSGVRGWPSAGCYNEASLVAIANDNQPQTVWASKKGDFEDFETGSGDDDAFIYTIPSSNRILWAAPLRELVLGTGDGVYKMTGGMDDYVSPTNVRIRPEIAIGAMNLDPIKVSRSLLYWQKGGRKLRELTYDPQTYDETYVSPDMSLLADHITVGAIKYSAWQQEPNSILWTVRADGVLLAMTYMRPEDIVGWSRHITDGEVESVAVIPDPTDSRNEAWVTVKRTRIASPDSDTVLFLHMDGLDDGTTFIDSSASGHTVTASGTAKTDTAQKKFGISSGLFSAAGLSYLTIPDHADFDFSADDVFTIEFFLYQETLVSGGVVSQATDTNNWFHVFIWADGHVSLIVTDTTSQIVSTAAAVLTTDIWQHIRVVGDGTNYYLFVDGELLVTEAIVESMQNFTGDLIVGYNADQSTYMSGWVDDLKISDLARSTADFAVPVTNLEVHRYIEYMDPDMMVDSGITYSGAAVASVSGADHLEGETVDLVGDGVQYDQVIVLNGVISVDPAASEIQIGLPYTSTLRTMKPIINSERGTTAGLPKKWAEVWASLYETSGLIINDEIIDFQGDIAPGQLIPLYTGNKKVAQLGWNDGRITIEHSAPLPCTILGIFGTLEVGN